MLVVGNLNMLVITWHFNFLTIAKDKGINIQPREVARPTHGFGYGIGWLHSPTCVSNMGLL